VGVHFLPTEEGLPTMMVHIDFKYAMWLVQSDDVTTRHFNNGIVVIRQYMTKDDCGDGNR
jgi:hypothetical protein